MEGGGSNEWEKRGCIKGGRTFPRIFQKLPTYSNRRQTTMKFDDLWKGKHPVAMKGEKRLSVEKKEAAGDIFEETWARTKTKKDNLSRK